MHQKSTLEDELKAELEEVIKAVAQQAADAATRVNSLQSACQQAELDARRQLEDRKAKLTQRLAQAEQELLAGARAAGQQPQRRPASARAQKHERERADADLRAKHTSSSEPSEVIQDAPVESTGATVDADKEVMAQVANLRQVATDSRPAPDPQPEQQQQEPLHPPQPESLG